MIEVKKIAEKWEIWNKEEEEEKKLVPECFHKQIHMFGKKQSERMPTRKLQDHAIKIKKKFVLRKEKMYPLSRKEREEVYEFISEQLKKGYIRLLKLPQTVLVFFIEKKDSKKRIV